MPLGVEDHVRIVLAYYGGDVYHALDGVEVLTNMSILTLRWVDQACIQRKDVELDS